MLKVTIIFSDRLYWAGVFYMLAAPIKFKIYAYPYNLNQVSCPVEIYTFRTAHALLDRNKELANRRFYFASLAELNDKIEGLLENSTRR